jgi:4-alpha-glucanotransferase
VASAPDETSPDGQDWGLPVYDWAAWARDDFSWVKARAMRAGELFGLCRVDHVIGLYRTYFKSAGGKSHGFTPYREPALAIARLQLQAAIVQSASRHLQKPSATWNIGAGATSAY